ncbi:Phenylacetic acid degradation protein paaI [Roseomonas mucosa]|jgi:acyl-CoA thioesterase|uniref:Phenylacetic acid degradation protein PaaD n=1 Tax=Roseomonas mucosa TaxID=207340 RepID=A0A1S8D866_9PROT|nr:MULTISPECIES: hydroxyphenylacetyl-CoA thioesterase PaaI [Roseomonas]MDT8266207.1 hydroxyphenylacetyl-CoA thioesterase PaaI [Roseomonas sp. DSM 102946]ATR21680.1 phenylacetic acid degradation protein PaaD [Roseomonas sp. FDAARGOS_362]AWV21624.1 Phenylacetic acid degradation protein paaI [Roseomonas mucosa]MDT8275296.1 hydroxyphenylacetyl-CoA thioesterase PaaI [Roseomonas mucosa]MDT8355336.1 hydroxyphenylacetyl-CoA thioesterase PaaI [Roseomonas mucosa]
MEMEAQDPAQRLAERCVAAMLERDPASSGLGMRLLRVAPGEAELSMRIVPHMLNGHQNCHGGFIFTLADSAFACACNSFDRLTVGQSCTIHYIRPVTAGTVLTARARCLAEAGRSGIYDVLVLDEQEQVVATFRGQSRTVGGSMLGGE